jgi:hypothetical protein
MAPRSSDLSAPRACAQRDIPGSPVGQPVARAQIAERPFVAVVAIVTHLAPGAVEDLDMKRRGLTVLTVLVLVAVSASATADALAAP